MRTCTPNTPEIDLGLHVCRECTMYVCVYGKVHLRVCKIEQREYIVSLGLHGTGYHKL